MSLFLHGHATHPDWRMAIALAAAQVDAQRAAAGTPAPTLGWLYLTEHYAGEAAQVLADARLRWPGVAWVGATGVGVCASGVEYFDEPGLVLMLAALPANDFRVFSGTRPLADFDAATAQVHAGGATADLPELIAEMAARTRTGYLFGGLASGRQRNHHLADEVLDGGLSGVAFGSAVSLVSRVTQGCQPVGPARTVTRAERNLALTLDGEPALDCLLTDLDFTALDPQQALPRLRETLVGLSDARADALSRHGQFGTETRVRHIIGFDPARRGLALADAVNTGMQLAFCHRDIESARRDLVRICAEIRDELEPETMPLATALALRGSVDEGTPHPARGIAGAVYVSCAGRGGPHFGGPSAELAIVRHALGDVPLAGFFAAGEIARDQLFGYTGVLTVFAAR